MRIRFYQDPITGQPHINGHGVSESEVEQVLAKPGENRPAADETRIALGQTEAGRYLRVIYVPDPEDSSIFVITAFELQGKQLRAYRRRRRKKKK